MKVLKFGGTSVGTVESLSNVRKIVEANEDPVIVVVSALGGITDRLINTAKLAAESNDAYLKEFDSISQRHFHIIDQLVEEKKRDKVRSDILILLNNLKKLYDGLFLIGHLPKETLNVIVSFGERMSSIIVTSIIKGATLHNSLNFIKTEDWFSKAIADRELTETLIKQEFPTSEKVAIVPGFISTDKDSGEITNLGRGGSDFTAALIAAALDADLLEIWTDVDGFMTADPRIIPEAAIVPHLTFIECMELCTMGAKVVYPPTIYPVFHKNIPIKILNTFNPEAAGTLINESRSSSDLRIKGVTSMKGTSLFNLSVADESNLASFNTRTLNVLARKGITIYLTVLTNEASGFSFTVAEGDARNTEKVLRSEFAPELSDGSLSCIDHIDNLATLAVVGEDMKNDTRIGPRICNTLSRQGIHVYASSEGRSETTVSCVVASEDIIRSLQLIHPLFFH